MVAKYNLPVSAMLAISMSLMGIAAAVMFYFTQRLYQLRAEAYDGVEPPRKQVAQEMPGTDERIEHGLERAYWLRDLGFTKRALAACDQVLMLDPASAEAYNLHGILIESLRGPEEARHSYKRALEIDPDFEEALQNLQSLDTTPAQPEPQPQPAVAQKFSAGQMLWGLLAMLACRFILPLAELGRIIGMYSALLLMILGVPLGTFLALRWLGRRVLPERAQLLLTPAAIQASAVLLLLVFAERDLLALGLLGILLYTLSIIWLTLIPNLTACVITITAQIMAAMVSSTINLVSFGLGSLEGLSAVAILAVSFVVIRSTMRGYSNLQEFDQRRRLAHRMESQHVPTLTIGGG
ncbi:MAG: hypothetical protein M3R61_11110 [Chloroflexota bacterium]|nr:hypothetical protein [Chloroflexota bacterium]